MHYLREEIFPPGHPCPECHAAAVCELPGGVLMAAWYAGAYETALDVAIYASHKAPGETWSEPRMIVNTPGYSEGNPTLYVDSQGTLWLFYATIRGKGWHTCELKYTRSQNGGHDWEPPVMLREEWGWMTSNKPITLEDGAILLPLYEERGAAFTLRSEDGGASWSASNLVKTPWGVIQPALAARPDGTIQMYLRTYEPESQERTVWRSVSGDGGRSWGAPRRVCLPNPNARVDVQSLRSGTIAIAFNDTPLGRSPLTLALSEDEGESWPWRVDVETDAAEFSYPAMIESSDGLCHLVYTHRRVNIAHIAFDEEWLRAASR
jgi:predicted neuraminidase